MVYLMFRNINSELSVKIDYLLGVSRHSPSSFPDTKTYKSAGAFRLPETWPVTSRRCSDLTSEVTAPLRVRTLSLKSQRGGKWQCNVENATALRIIARMLEFLGLPLYYVGSLTLEGARGCVICLAVFTAACFAFWEVRSVRL